MNGRVFIDTNILVYIYDPLDCHVVDMTKLISLEAIRGVETHHFSFWDAQIWATARLNQIEEIYSEDFPSGANIEGVKFTNPFTLSN